MTLACTAQGRSEQLLGTLQLMATKVSAPRLVAEGRVTELRGLALVAEGCCAPIGGQCWVYPHSGAAFTAEVVGFSDQRLYLMPIGDPGRLEPGARVVPILEQAGVAVGPQLLGRVIDGRGRPLDGLGEIRTEEFVELQGATINPFERAPICEPLDVGVRALNALCTIGRGQRIGLFAGSGVGKSTLLGLMTRFTAADVVVVGLVGERGREVREFVETILGSRERGKAVVVASPADDPPLMRIHAAWRATAIAEYFRDQGMKVLLLMDSLTRFAQAQREIALAIGEAPVTRGYPPSVFVQLPRLVERAGNGDSDSGGSITAFYTVLAEGDDQQEPIADATRAILDGHVVLSRQMAEAGIYPAIDIDASISRVMPAVVDERQQKMAQQFRRFYACYQQNRDLVTIGAYEPGSDPELDEAIKHYPQLLAFLQQGIDEQADFEQSTAQLQEMALAWGMSDEAE